MFLLIGGLSTSNMSNIITPPVPWDRFLKEVDEQLPSDVTLHCIGGFVLTALYGVPRTTDDLDHISVFPREAYEAVEAIAGLGSKLAKKHKVYIHSAGVVNLPENYDERLTGVPFGHEKLHIVVPDPYDLALSKLERNSPKDRFDVRFLAGKCNLSFDELMSRFDSEMRPWIPNLERHLTTLTVVWREYFPATDTEITH